MAVQLNHTIVWCRDQQQSSTFVTEILGLPPPTKFAHFDVVALANDLSLDFADTDRAIEPQHYAFLITEEEFDGVFARIQERAIDYWADPMQSQQGKINTRDGGRGLYFEAPDGHLLEVITRPYGSGGSGPT